MTLVEATREEARYKAAPQRCPFCHEQVQLEQEKWVACGQCLARHHAACWTEAPVCGACSHGVALSAGEALPALGPVPADEADPGRARRETAALFERDDAREQWWVDAVAGPLTLGVVPLLRAERVLARHDEGHRHDVPEPPPEGLSGSMASRWTEARKTTSASYVRKATPLGLIVFGALGLLVSLVMALAADKGDDYGYGSEFTRMLPLIVSAAGIGTYTILLAVYGHLHAFRESVRAHERRQLFLQLTSAAVPGAVAEQLLALTWRQWNTRRALDTFLTVLGLVPGYGLLLLPIVMLRLSGALGLHARNEDLLAEVTQRATEQRKG